LFFLALLSKENAIVLPAVFALDLLLFSPRKARQWLRLVPVGCVALVYLALRIRVLGALGIPASAQYMVGRLHYLDRLLTSGRVFIKYLTIILYPLNLAGDYDFNAIPIARLSDWDAWAGLLLIGAVVAGAIYFYRRGNRV